jgi:hypothetical protein
VNCANENAPAWDRGARKSDSNTSKPQPTGAVKDYEDRRNAAACFRNPNKVEEWHADFTGLLVTDNFPAGAKCWVNVYERTDCKGRQYLSVVLRPQRKSREP